MNYRKIWEDAFGPIPVDEDGRTYEIHHIDGDNTNNSLENLQCVSIKEHYNIHYSQGDFMACAIMSDRMLLIEEEKRKMHKLAMKKRDQTGEKNPNWGKSSSERVKKYWDTVTQEERKKFAKKVSKTRVERGSAKGSNNPMFGRSAVKEQNLVWYTNGVINKYIPEGTNPDGFIRGRTTKWSTKKKI